MARWTKLTQFTGDPYLQSMMGHGLKAASQAELTEKLVTRGFLVCPPHVQAAFASVDRKLFCQAEDPYSNKPVKISKHHAMSTPQFHAQIISLLSPALGPGRVAGEVGAGSGYLPAVMTAAGCETVVACESDPDLRDICHANLPSSVRISLELPSAGLVYDALYVAPYFESRASMLGFLRRFAFSEDACAVASFGDSGIGGQQLCLLEKHVEKEWHIHDLFRVMGEAMTA